MKKITSLILLAGFSMLAWGQNPVSMTVEQSNGTPSSYNLKNMNGYWHISGPRSNENNNNLSVFWKTGSYQRYLTILDNGNIGIGNSTPSVRLDVNGTIRASQINTVSSNQSTYINALCTNTSTSVSSIIKAAYNYNETSQERSARLELGSTHKRGDTYYSKVWSLEAISTNTWANLPRFRISRGDKAMINIGYYGEVGIGKIASTDAKLDVAGNIKAHEIEVTLAAMQDLQLNGTLAANNITYTANGNTADFVFEDNYQLKDLSEVEAYIKANKHLPEIPSATEMEATGVNLAEMNKLLLMKVEELTLYSIEQEKKIEELTEDKKRVLELEARMEKLEALLTN